MSAVPPLLRYLSPARALDLLQTRLGYRGAVLLLVGLLWCLIGADVHASPYTDDSATPVLLYENFPTGIRIGLWIATGLVAVWAAWQRSPVHDRWGFTALVLMPLERAFGNLAGYVLHLAGIPDGAYDDGLAMFVSWLLVCAVIMVCAGWPEPTGLKPSRAEPRDLAC